MKKLIDKMKKLPWEQPLEGPRSLVKRYHDMLTISEERQSEWGRIMTDIAMRKK